MILLDKLYNAVAHVYALGVSCQQESLVRVNEEDAFLCMSYCSPGLVLATKVDEYAGFGCEITVDFISMSKLFN